jgi:hypothetical protein
MNVLPVRGHKDAKWRWAVNGMPWLLFSWEKDPVPTVQDAGWASEPIWIGTQNLASHWCSKSDYPGHSKLLYNYGIPATNCTMYIQPSNHTGLNFILVMNVSRRVL